MIPITSCIIPVLSLVIYCMSLQNYNVAHVSADESPDRDAFIREVLDARPTKLTSQFNDDDDGDGYHINKEDLSLGLTEEATRKKINLRGVLIIGPLPADPLRTYTVFAFIQEADAIRVNTVVMPHARITRKATGMLKQDEYDKVYREIIKASVTDSIPKSVRIDKTTGRPVDTDYQVLFAVGKPDVKQKQLYYGLIEDKETASRIGMQLDPITKHVKQTYPDK